MRGGKVIDEGVRLHSMWEQGKDSSYGARRSSTTLYSFPSTEDDSLVEGDFLLAVLPHAGGSGSTWLSSTSVFYFSSATFYTVKSNRMSYEMAGFITD